MFTITLVLGDDTSQTADVWIADLLAYEDKFNRVATTALTENWVRDVAWIAHHALTRTGAINEAYETWRTRIKSWDVADTNGSGDALGEGDIPKGVPPD